MSTSWTNGLSLSGKARRDNEFSEPQPASGSNHVESAVNQAWPDLAAAIQRLNWPEIGSDLTEHGFAYVPHLLQWDRM